MPAQVIRDTEGREVNLGALQGRTILINLWATWCAPCVEELPLLERFAHQHYGEVRLLTISQDRKGAEVVGPFLAERRFTMIEPWLDPESKLEQHYGAGLPVSILYDGSGREVWRIAGAFDWSSAEAAGALDEAIAATE